jgi:hypothetical protein
MVLRLSLEALAAPHHRETRAAVAVSSRTRRTTPSRCLTRSPRVRRDSARLSSATSFGSMGSSFTSSHTTGSQPRGPRPSRAATSMAPGRCSAAARSVLSGAVEHIPDVPFLPLIPSTAGGRSVLDGLTVHIADVQTDRDEFSTTSENARRQGFRTILSVPLMREGVAAGAIILRRTEAQPFTERQGMATCSRWPARVEWSSSGG